MSTGLVARLKAPLRQRADFSRVLVGSWTTLSAGELAQRPVHLHQEGETRLGDLVAGAPSAPLPGSRSKQS